jgi:putative Holliday junction resolvase
VIVVGIDLGSKRIGLAVSDETGVMAFPAGALESRGPKADVKAVCAWIRERGAEAAVVGLPIHMDGREGIEAEAARRFAAALGERSGVAVELLDERWTSSEAERVLRQAPGGHAKRRRRREQGAVDSAAATILLRTFLERRAAPGAGS